MLYSPHNCPKHCQVHFLQIAYSVLFNLQGAIQCQTLQYMQFNNNATYWKNCISEQYARSNNAIMPLPTLHKCNACQVVCWNTLQYYIECNTLQHCISVSVPWPGEVDNAQHEVSHLRRSRCLDPIDGMVHSRLCTFLLNFYLGHSLGPDLINGRNHYGHYSPLIL